MREKRPFRDRKNEDFGTYYQKLFRLPKPVKILILDAEGLIHVYHFSHPHFAIPELSMYTRALSIGELKEKEMRLKEKLKPKQKNRSKSQDKRAEGTQVKKRSKSQGDSSSRKKIMYIFS